MKMRIGVASLLATAWTFGAAAAADLTPAPMITKAPPMPVAYNWTGWYIGLNVGGGFARQDTSLTGVGTNSLNLDGVVGGGQLGYNWQGNGSPWVFGLEADIQGSDQHNGNGAFAVAPVVCSPFAIACFGGLGSAIAYQDKLEWFGTVRGRVGVAAGSDGSWLPYVTGGLAYGQGNISGGGNLGATAVAFATTTTYVGWTAGAGIEWAFAHEWSAKLEYLYMDLGNGPTIALVPGINLAAGHLTDNIARVGINWHF